MPKTNWDEMLTNPETSRFVIPKRFVFGRVQGQLTSTSGEKLELWSKKVCVRPGETYKVNLINLETGEVELQRI